MFDIEACKMVAQKKAATSGIDFNSFLLNLPYLNNRYSAHQNLFDFPVMQ